MTTNLHIAFTLLIVLCAELVCAQAPQKLQFYGVSEGLSSPIATCLAEDSTGFIWVGTKEGLNRFDGVNFVSYRTDTITGMRSDEVIGVHHLQNDRLLVGLVNSGIALFDPKNERVTYFDTVYNTDKQPFLLPYFFMTESDSTAIVGFRRTPRHAGGLVRANYRSFTQEVLVEDFDGFDRLIVDSVTGDVWAVGDHLRRALDPSLRHWEEIESPFVKSITSPYYSDIVFLGDTVAIGSRGDGIHLYSKRRQAFLRNDLWVVENRRIAQNIVHRMLPAENGGLWVATGDAGLAFWRRSDGRFDFTPADVGRQHHMEDLDFFGLLNDSYGNFWAATGSGLVQWRSRDEGLYYRTIDPPEFPKFTSYYVRTAAQGNTLVTLTARHMNGYILDGESMEVLGRFPIDSTMNGHRHFLNADYIFTAKNGLIYCLGNNHINRKFKDDKSFRPWVDLKPIVQSEYNQMSTMTLDHEGEIWVGTTDNLVLRVNEEGAITGRWWLVGDTIANSPLNTAVVDRKGRNLVAAIASDGLGGVLVASYFGVFQVNDRGVTGIEQLCASCGRLNNNVFYNAASHGQRVAFPSQRLGVFVYDGLKKELRHYDRSNGLQSTRVDDLAFDADGGMWGIGPNGLFSIHEGDHVRIENYIDEPGMPYSNLSWHRLSSGADGMLYIGMAAGLSRINPKKLQSQAKPRRVVLHSVRVAEHIVYRQISKVYANFGESLEVLFAALGFDRARTYRYAWRIEGDEHWQEIDQPRVTFSALQEGDFTLEFKAGNRDGEWADEVLRLEVEVNTPFFQSAAFRWLLALAFVLLVFMVFQITVRRNRERERSAQAFSRRITELELQALRAQMNPHFLFNTLNSIKFFIIRNEPDTAADYLTKFSRLIRFILSNSKSERIALSTELEALRLYVELERLRFGKQFDFVLSVDDSVEPDYVQVPPLIVQPYVENAIWHGLMHKDTEGRLEVRLSLDGENLVVEVDDNGIGRAAAASIRSKTATKEKSMGMDITRNRLRISSDGREGRVEIVDYLSETHGRSGTLVKITIPVEL